MKWALLAAYALFTVGVFAGAWGVEPKKIIRHIILALFWPFIMGATWSTDFNSRGKP